MRVPLGGTRTDYSSKWDEFLLSKKNPRHRLCIAGSVGSDGLGTLTDRAVFTWKSKQYRFVLPKVLVA
jgi:hypothetical protein